MAVRDYEALIQATARKYGLNPQLLRSIMELESHGVNGQTSRAGAMGLMQLMPSNVPPGRNPWDPATNIDIAGSMLKGCSDRTHGDLAGIAICYNCGPGCLGRSSQPSETRNYITNLRNLMGSGTATAGAPSPNIGGGTDPGNPPGGADPVQAAINKVGATLLQPLLVRLLGLGEIIAGLIAMAIGFYILIKDTGPAKAARQVALMSATRGMVR